MSQKTDAQLTTQAQIIRDETTALANTKSRVYTNLKDAIDSKINNDRIIDEDNMASDSAVHIPTQQSVKQFVEDSIEGAALGIVTSWKNPVRVATTVNGTLATDFENGDTIDGVVLASGDRILLKNQSDQTVNGIYVVAASGAPSRSSDANTGTEIEGAGVTVLLGTTNANSTWLQTTDSITLGVSNIVWTQLGTNVPPADGTTPGIAKLYNNVSGTNTDGAADQNSVKVALDLKAPLASPTFTGTPTLPTGTTGVTQSAADDSTKLATTAFVQDNSIGFNPADELTEIAGITLEGDITAAQLLEALAIPGCIPIHCDGAATIIFTDMASALTAVAYGIVKFNTVNIRRMRLHTRVVTVSASVNNPRMYIQYSINGGSSYVTLGAGTIASGDAISLFTGAAGVQITNWITLPSEARGDSFVWRVVTEGGNATADPAVASIYIEYTT